MSEPDSHLIRRYLLDDVDAATESALDERLLTDPAFLDDVALLEDDIVEEYARGTVPPEDFARVERFLAHPDRNRRLRITSELVAQFQSDHHATPERESIVASAPADRRRATRWRNSTIGLAAAASLVMSTGTALYFGVENNRLHAELGNLASAVRERPVNVTPPPEALPSFLILPDATSRSSGAITVPLSVPATATAVELQFSLDGNTAQSSYDVAIRRDGAQVWGAAAVVPSRDRRDAIAVKVPGAILTPEDYLVVVSATGGAQIAEYRFRVAAR